MNHQQEKAVLHAEYRIQTEESPFKSKQQLNRSLIRG